MRNIGFCSFANAFDDGRFTFGCENTTTIIMFNQFSFNDNFYIWTITIVVERFNKVWFQKKKKNGNGDVSMTVENQLLVVFQLPCRDVTVRKCVAPRTPWAPSWCWTALSYRRTARTSRYWKKTFHNWPNRPKAVRLNRLVSDITIVVQIMSILFHTINDTFRVDSCRKTQLFKFVSISTYFTIV